MRICRHRTWISISFEHQHFMITAQFSTNTSGAGMNMARILYPWAKSQGPHYCSLSPWCSIIRCHWLPGLMRRLGKKKKYLPAISCCAPCDSAGKREGRGAGSGWRWGGTLWNKGGLQSHKSPPKFIAGSTWRGLSGDSCFCCSSPTSSSSPYLSLSLCLCSHPHYSSSVMSSLHSIFSMLNNISMSSIHPSVSVCTVRPLMRTPLWQLLDRI